MYVIGIDIGTGSTKAIALESSGSVLVTSQVPYPTMNSLPGVSEQDPETVWAAFTKCISRITSSLREPPLAIALSSAMHSVICVDQNGNPLSNLITWADNRSSDSARMLKNSAQGERLYIETGTPIHAMSPLCKLLWLKESNPELFDRTSKFISIKEYCWFKLFGCFEVDFSIASATGLFNITSLTWHKSALELLGIDENRLSKPVNTNWYRDKIQASAAEILHVGDDLKILIGGSDGCLANVGSFATRPGVAALTIGTSGAIRVAGDTVVSNITYMPFNYRLNEKTVISGGPINNGGVALKWYAESLLKKNLSRTEDYDNLLATLSSTPAGCDGLVFLPYILGERAPIWNSESCGVFFGITAQHKQEHFTRAVIEGITFSLFQIAKTLEEGGLAITEIHVSGGFVRSSAWVQILANIFGKRVCLTNIDDASAIGAAIIAMDTLDIKHQIEENSKRESRTFEPDQNEHKNYREKYFPMYENLYRALVLEMKIFHENRIVSDLSQAQTATTNSKT
jgi:gluconokinase